MKLKTLLCVKPQKLCCYINTATNIYIYILTKNKKILYLHKNTTKKLQNMQLKFTCEQYIQYYIN